MDQLYLFRPVKGKNSEQLNRYLEWTTWTIAACCVWACYPNGPTLSTETLSESPVAKERSIDINEKRIIQSVLLERRG
jgi:hypothetical protein